MPNKDIENNAGTAERKIDGLGDGPLGLKNDEVEMGTLPDLQK